VSASNEADRHRTYTRVSLAADAKRVGRLNVVLDLLEVENGRVLDIGCGPGVQFCGHAGNHRFTGVDISAKALKHARENGYETVMCDLARSLPFADQQFDVVVLSDILEHLVDPLALIKEAWRVLRLDGYAVVSVPNHFYLLNRLRILRGSGIILPWANHQEYEDWNYFHMRFFRWKSLCSLLDRSGFAIEEDLTGAFFAPFPRPLALPVLRHCLAAIRSLTRFRWRDLWCLHFLVVCRRCRV